MMEIYLTLHWRLVKIYARRPRLVAFAAVVLMLLIAISGIYTIGYLLFR